jgi:hypothetical protein
MTPWCLAEVGLTTIVRFAQHYGCNLEHLGPLQHLKVRQIISEPACAAGECPWSVSRDTLDEGGNMAGQRPRSSR